MSHPRVLRRARRLALPGGRSRRRRSAFIGHFRWQRSVRFVSFGGVFNLGWLGGIVYARKTRSHRREAHLVTRCEVRVAAVHLSGTSVGSAAVVSFRWVGFSFGFARRHSVRSQSTLAPTRYTHCDEACHHRRAFSLAARRSFRFVWWVSHLGLLGGLVYVRKARPHRRETRLVTRRAIIDAVRKQ